MALRFLWLPVAGFVLMGAGFSTSRSLKRKLVLFFVDLSSGLGGGSGRTGSPTYTITVTGTSGSTQHSTTTTLMVQ
jgi:hypothetical protein